MIDACVPHTSSYVFCVSNRQEKSKKRISMMITQSLPSIIRNIHKKTYCHLPRRGKCFVSFRSIREYTRTVNGTNKGVNVTKIPCDFLNVNIFCLYKTLFVVWWCVKIQFYALQKKCFSSRNAQYNIIRKR
jgi:hypothetical protein